MKSTIKYILLFPILLLIQNCKSGDNKTENYELSNDYAKYFNIGQDADSSFRLLINENWNGENRVGKYKLVSRD